MDLRAGIIVLAGGSGSRFGGSVNKVYQPLNGLPVLAHSIAALAPLATQLVIVARPEDGDFARYIAASAIVCAGGKTRTDSERSGLEAIRDSIDSLDVIAIHDGARPFITRSLAKQLLQTAFDVGGAVPGLEVTDLPSVPVDRILRIDDKLWRVQTPQAFRARPLLNAFDAAPPDYSAADTSELVEAFSELAVTVVAGDPDNRKITSPGDL